MIAFSYDIDIAELSGDWPEAKALIQRAIGAAMAVLDTPRFGELSVALCDDAHIRSLNREFRNKDKATNVLSFPIAPPAPLLGDIVLASETLRREADEKDITFESHMTHLLIHGYLHLQGYDHQNEAEADIMEALEIRALSKLGIDNPYKT